MDKRRELLTRDFNNILEECDHAASLISVAQNKQKELVENLNKRTDRDAVLAIHGSQTKFLNILFEMNVNLEELLNVSMSNGATKKKKNKNKHSKSPSSTTDSSDNNIRSHHNKFKEPQNRELDSSSHHNKFKQPQNRELDSPSHHNKFKHPQNRELDSSTISLKSCKEKLNSSLSDKSYASVIGSSNYTTASETSYVPVKKEIKKIQNVETVQTVSTEKVIEVPVLPKPEECCYVSCFSNPGDLYIQVLNYDLVMLKHLMDQISNLCKNSLAPFAGKAQAMREINQYCIVYVDKWDLNWYRAEVLNWNFKDKSLVKVQLIDYGNIVDVDYSDLRILPDKFCFLRKIAVPCCLAYLSPKTVDNKWPKDIKAKIMTLLGEERSNCYKIMFVDNAQLPIAIDILDEYIENEDNTLSQMLCDADLAEICIDVNIPGNNFINGQVTASQGLPETHENMSLNEFLESAVKSIKFHESDSLGQALENYDAQDEVRICKFAKNGTCFKKGNCKLEHISFNKNGYTTDRQQVFKSTIHKRLSSPPKDDYVNIFVTYFKNINIIYGRIFNEREKELALKQLNANINSFINSFAPCKILPGRGEVVIAKHLDGNWYRARVEEIQALREAHDETLLTVFFLDFGDTIRVPLNEVKMIKEQYLYLPFQAITFRIADIKPNGNIHASDYFDRKYVSRKMRVKVLFKRSPDDWVVELYDLNNQNIADRLISLKYADKNDMSSTLETRPLLD